MRTFRRILDAVNVLIRLAMLALLAWVGLTLTGRAPAWLPLPPVITLPAPLVILTRPAAPAAHAETRAKLVNAAKPYGTNYAGNPQMRGLHRWRRLPVRVYFAPGDAYSAERKRLALAGFAQWTEATGGAIRPSLVAAAREADVVVRFSRGAHVPPGPNTLGRTAFQVWGNTLRRAEMVLATANVRPDELTETAAHEWGHALGIDGHSDNPADLMYAVSVRYVSPSPLFVPPPTRTVTPRDLNTLKAAYPSLFSAGAR